jgi:hypothetical protein
VATEIDCPNILGATEGGSTIALFICSDNVAEIPNSMFAIADEAIDDPFAMRQVMMRKSRFGSKAPGVNRQQARSMSALGPTSTK